LLQFQQDGIESALIHGQQISADLLDAPRDAVAVERTQNIESLEDHQCQRALQDVGFLFHGTAIWVSNRKDGIVPFGNNRKVAGADGGRRLIQLLERVLFDVHGEFGAVDIPASVGSDAFR